MPKTDVSMVLKTVGLEYDDRVRKECESLLRAGARVRLVVLESSNVAETRRIWGGVTVASFQLTTRRIFAQGRGLLLKLVEFNGRALLDILGDKPTVVWAHNQEALPLVVLALLLRRFGKIHRIVWDQHELPADLVFRHRALCWLWSRVMRECDVVVVANHERAEYLRERLPQGSAIRIAVLENRADRALRELPSRPLPEEIDTWARGRPYVLLQGGAHPGRHFTEVVTAILDRLQGDIGLVVVGGSSDTLVASMRDRWGTSFDDQVFLTGLIPQMDIPVLIDHAVASLILYEGGSANSVYCAPNRLYQAIARGTPVIVGANPPMAKLVRRHGLGVVLDGMGESQAEIAGGISALMSSRSSYRTAVVEVRDRLMWEEQEVEFSRILDGTIDADSFLDETAQRSMFGESRCPRS